MGLHVASGQEHSGHPDGCVRPASVCTLAFFVALVIRSLPSNAQLLSSYVSEPRAYYVQVVRLDMQSCWLNTCLRDDLYTSTPVHEHLRA